MKTSYKLYIARIIHFFKKKCYESSLDMLLSKNKLEI